jgi:hypothetical protein
MADVIEFDPAKRSARRNPGPPMTAAEVRAHTLRDALLDILSGARDLEHAQIANVALCDIEEDGGSKAPG